ncbi:MAG: glycoside hydrolase family 88 protein [Mediterranea sp.]|jgi:unsaturated rhamnogalacturonyl hydrolase|nr:glycoside hydrolase family 88 protein [Mediterranea sp.]
MNKLFYKCSFYGILLGAVSGATQLMAQQVSDRQPWSVRMVESEMIRCPESWQLDFQPRLKWDYCHGLELQAMLDVYDTYGGEHIFDYAVAYSDTMVRDDGTILTYRPDEYNIDRLNPGKYLFRIYDRTKDAKYKKAIDLLRSQLDTHPRNDDGGFWHKKIYPNQMWLDGLYMGSPFYAEYAFRNSRPQDYADVVRQFLLAARHTYDPETQLYRHAADVSRKERWADPVTGQSAHSWGRAMGWYAMAIADALDFIPKHEAGRDSMLVILNNIAGQLARIQDKKTGLWYQVLDRSGDEGNYLESSCSAMFIYTLFKAVRMEYIDKSYLDVAIKGYKGLLDNLIEVDENGVISITKGCAVAGLGGKNYRSGTYEYYLSEPVRNNDPKAVGPFIMASLEWERLQRFGCKIN